MDCEVLDRGISGLGLWLMSSALHYVFGVGDSLDFMSVGNDLHWYLCLNLSCVWSLVFLWFYSFILSCCCSTSSSSSSSSSASSSSSSVFFFFLCVCV